MHRIGYKREREKKGKVKQLDVGKQKSLMCFVSFSVGSTINHQNNVDNSVMHAFVKLCVVKLFYFVLIAFCRYHMRP